MEWHKSTLGIIASIVLIVVLVIVLFVWKVNPNPLPPNIPQPKPQDYIKMQKGFNYLVSYTNDGFDMHALDIRQGETVRFTNNSSGTLLLSGVGPSTQTLQPQEYTEVTFTTKGSWTATNQSKGSAIVVRVK